jgi:hypothetical protein
LGTTANIDPVEGWKIVDGKLYLNYSRKIQKKWEKDIPNMIEFDLIFQFIRSIKDYILQILFALSENEEISK